MTLFCDTSAGAEFIATADSRNTSPEVMRAIAHFAWNEDEAIALWNGRAWGRGWSASANDIASHATDNGRLHSADLHWGDRTLDQIMSDEDAS